MNSVARYEEDQAGVKTRAARASDENKGIGSLFEPLGVMKCRPLSFRGARRRLYFPYSFLSH